jgi:hypothetical protein
MCKHGKLDPLNSSDMKLIRNVREIDHHHQKSRRLTGDLVHAAPEVHDIASTAVDRCRMRGLCTTRVHRRVKIAFVLMYFRYLTILIIT